MLAYPCEASPPRRLPPGFSARATGHLEDTSEIAAGASPLRERFALARMSDCGTKLPRQHLRRMSGIGGKPDVTRAFREVAI
jgi:hypothetical protein